MSAGKRSQQRCKRFSRYFVNISRAKSDALQVPDLRCIQASSTWWTALNYKGRPPRVLADLGLVRLFAAHPMANEVIYSENQLDCELDPPWIVLSSDSAEGSMGEVAIHPIQVRTIENVVELKPQL